jgi:puromycin-sensitive aminopeptidase
MAHPTDDRNFRLPVHVRPVSYEATLSVDLEARRFAGRERIALALASPGNEIVLHGVELDVGRAVCHAGGRTLAASRVERVPASETIVLRFPEAVAAGAAALELEWTGRMSPGLRGLYMAGGDLAVTQFEAADARRVFPCFDEPGFKAAWTIAIEAPEGATVISNAPVREEAVVSGRRRIVFRETPPLPTYLVALAAGRVEALPPVTVRGVPVRTWAVPEKVALTGFGQDVAVEVLPRLEDYFGVPYAFGKLDQVGVPDFEAGAMENAGLVTYREVVLLLDPATASLAQKKRVAEVITHELAHQWFGNWVTMAWWDDLWLNEAFATWMAYKIVDAWMPPWRVWIEFEQGKAAAMQLDALRSTHPIRAEVRNVAEAGEAFDLITYEKGGAVLRMIEAYLGAERFREGIRLYMRRHGRGNAVADDLWGALAEASREPVVELANAWIRQPGHPVVRVERAGRTLGLVQRRFYSDPASAAEADDAIWPVPVVVRYADSSGVKELRLVMSTRSTEIALPGEGEVAWVCANGGATGFYRVAYDVAAVADLARNLRALAPSERIALLSDEWALVRAGERDVRTFLELCAAFAADEDYAVLDELVARLAVVEHRLVSEEHRPMLAALVSRLFRPQLAAVGWDARAAEPDAVRLRRAAAVRALGLVAREPAVISEATARLDRWLAGDRAALEANLHDAAVTMAARGGDAVRFDAFRRLFEAEADPAFRRRYLLALAAFEDAALAARAREMPFGDSVPLQDSASFVAGLLANRAARDPFWDRLRGEWDRLHGRMKGAPMLLRRVVEAMGQLVDRRQLDEASAFLAAHPMDEATQAIAQTLERLRQDVELRERTQRAIGEWLATG